MASTADKSKPYLPLAGSASDGWSTETEATATCFCGAVQLSFVCLLSSLPISPHLTLAQPPQGPGLVGTFVCNCADCRKITASMFASNFTVLDSHLTHIRGRDNLSAFGQAKTIASGKLMTNYFCKTCGTLMYRVGEAFPGMSILRIGTVDDFNLQETKLRPQRELFVEDRVAWLSGADGATQMEGMGRAKM
jgi:hypothetical protein